MTTITDVTTARVLMHTLDHVADWLTGRSQRPRGRTDQPSASTVPAVALPTRRTRATITGWSVVRSTSRLRSSK